jgi:hypothetical protein
MIVVQKSLIEMRLENSEFTALEEFTAPRSLEGRVIDCVRQTLCNLPMSENWLSRMNVEQRQRFKDCGRRLVALLLQYAGRTEGGEVYLEEARRITAECSQVCTKSGFTLQETVRTFLFFSRTVLDVIYQTSQGRSEDYESQRLLHHTNDFLDELLINLMATYEEA